MEFSLSRKLMVECIGTAFLVCTVVGSGIMAETLTDDVALALLGNTLPTGAILVVLITLFGPVSGAHFNPAVSIVFAVRRQLDRSVLAPYIGAQILGGILGTFAAHLMFEQQLLQFSTQVRFGPSQWFAEIVASFGLLLAILFGVRFAKPAVPMLVGLYITAAYWFTASTSFANPAVAIARGLSDTFAGIRPIDVGPFIAAQLVGALLAAGFVAWFFKNQDGRAKTAGPKTAEPSLHGQGQKLE